MFTGFIKWLAQDHIASAYNRGVDDSLDRQRNSRKEIEIIRAEQVLGTKVIYCSNEVEDPLFGTVTGIDFVCQSKTPMLIVKCALTGNDHLVHIGTVYLADDQMIDAILKLTPFERWNLSVGKEYVDNMWSKAYPPRGELTLPEVIREKLKAVGFYTGPTDN